MMIRKLFFMLSFSFMAACGSTPETVSETAAVNDAAKHKTVKDWGISFSSPVAFYMVKTKDVTLENNYPSIGKFLTATDGSGNRKTLVPGKYKISLKKGEYLVTGVYWTFGTSQSYLGTMLFVENGKLKMKYGDALASSEVFTVPSPYTINLGSSGALIDAAKFTVTLKGSELTVNFPNYNDGRKF